VAPGFDFKDFELASRKDLLSKYPKEAEEVIILLTEGLP
jgi:predicted cupin superfamily sugar epimerase